MEYLIFCQIVLLLTGTSIKYVFGRTSSAIPELLLDCYKTDFETVAKPPATLLLLLELIRKIELDGRNALNARMLSSSMLHSIILDGIQKSENVAEDNFIPYRATGKEFDRYNLIVDYLIPGESDQFPKDSLSKPELCFLHKLLSNAVDNTNRGDEDKTCEYKSIMPLKQNISDEETVSACPRAFGNIRTNWGPISAGHLVAGIASVLDQNSMTFGRLQKSINVKKNITKPVITKESKSVDTLWVSTVAADLGEAILNQASEDLQIGNDGFWDDHLFPQAYYLKSDISDFYDAEVLGAMDAVNIANNVNTMTSNVPRLSQLIDIYYADAVISDITVANRSAQFNQALQRINLVDQVVGTVNLLQTASSYEVTLFEDDVKQLSSIAVTKFKEVADKISHLYETAEHIPNKKINTPLELIVIIDDTWDVDTAQKILYDLAESIQVSYYGSRMGVVNGLTGKWLANVTDSVFEMFTEFHKNRNSWPTSAALSVSLKTVIQYYQNRTYEDCKGPKLVPKGRAVIILAPSARLTTEVFKGAQEAVKTIKLTYPETNLIYVASDQNHNTYNDLVKSSNGNDTILYNVKDPNTLVAQLGDKLGSIPAGITNSYCGKSGEQKRFEDYITPNVETIYEIHTEYIRRADIEIKFRGHGYGDVKICVLSPKGTNNDCNSIRSNDVSYNSKNYCAVDTRCYLQFSVRAGNSSKQCLENECRYLNQVRIDIFYKTNSATIVLNTINIFVIIALVISIS